MGVDERNHQFAPGLPPGWSRILHFADLYQGGRFPTPPPGTHQGFGQTVGALDAVPRHTLSVVSEAGSHLRLIDYCITQLEAQGPSRTCNESKEEEDTLSCWLLSRPMHYSLTGLHRRGPRQGCQGLLVSLPTPYTPNLKLRKSPYTLPPLSLPAPYTPKVPYTP